MSKNKRSKVGKWWRDVYGWLNDLSKNDRKCIVRTIKQIETERKADKKSAGFINN